jgi:hypothetical protein
MLDQLNNAILAAKTAWQQAEVAERSVTKFSDIADKARAECGRQLIIAQAEHAKSGINVPWHEWAPQAFGGSYSTIKRLMQDGRDPEAAARRREAQRDRDRAGSRREPQWTRDNMSPEVRHVIGAVMMIDDDELAVFSERFTAFDAQLDAALRVLKPRPGENVGQIVDRYSALAAAI